MSDLSSRIVTKLWSYCHVIRDDGLSDQDDFELLNHPLFLEVAGERARITGVEPVIPKGYR